MLNLLLLSFALSGAPAKGTYDHAMADAESCDTATSWVEADLHHGAPFWYAVCGTPDGLICGEDASWTSEDCASPDEPSESPPASE